MIKFKSLQNIFKSSNKSHFLINSVLWNFVHLHKMSTNWSAKFYQENEESLQKKASERYQSLSKEEKERKLTVWSWKIEKSIRG